MKISNLEFYTKPNETCKINSYIGSLQHEERKKALKDFDRMLKPGVAEAMLKTQDIKDFKGNKNKNLYELRSASNRFIFCMKNTVAWFLHAFKKKTNKTPQKHIDKALTIRDIVMSNKEE